jgi:multiple sugar transport system permease protein
MVLSLSRKTKVSSGLAVLYVFIFLTSVIALFPIYWLVVTALKPPIEWLNFPPIFFPSRLYFDTYIELFKQETVIRAIRNTVVVAVLGTVFALLFASMVAYSLSRINFKFKRPMLIWILFNRMIPPVTLIIPYFLIMRNMGMLDSLTGLIISRIYLTFPFITWMMMGFFQTIPMEIDQAAKIDGCDFVNRYIRIGVPLGKVGFATTGIFVFLASWNELLFSVTIAAERSKTLPIVISGFIGENSLQWGPMTALSVITILPVFIIALLAQRYFVSGLTLGAIKG